MQETANPGKEVQISHSSQLRPVQQLCVKAPILLRKVPVDPIPQPSRSHSKGPAHADSVQPLQGTWLHRSASFPISSKTPVLHPTAQLFPRRQPRRTERLPVGAARLPIRSGIHQLRDEIPPRFLIVPQSYLSN